jgi:hypothetical protein
LCNKHHISCNFILLTDSLDKDSVRENENTSIVKDSSLLSTQLSDHKIEQEHLLLVQQDIIPSIAEQILITHHLPKKMKTKAYTLNKVEDLDKEFDSKDSDDVNMDEQKNLIGNLINFNLMQLFLMKKDI